MKRLYPVLFLLLVLVACAGNQKQQEVETLKEEVMAIHDSSMVKMDAIYGQIKKLRDLEAEMALDSTGGDPEVKTMILDAIGLLRMADDGMMDWMAAYKEPTAEEEPETSLAYLKKEKVSITQVDEMIDKSLEKGQEVLDRAKQ